MNWFFWALLSALFAGLTAILAKIGVAGVNANLATAIRTTVVLVFTWGIALATTNPSAMLSLPRRTWVFLVLSGLATGLSWLCYFRALQLGEASRVAPVDKLSVVFAIALAVIFARATDLAPMGRRRTCCGGRGGAGLEMKIQPHRRGFFTVRIYFPAIFRARPGVTSVCKISATSAGCGREIVLVFRRAWWRCRQTVSSRQL